MVQQVQLSDGQLGYATAEEGLEFVEVLDAENHGVNAFIAVADMATHLAQTDLKSHVPHFFDPQQRNNGRGHSQVGLVSGQDEVAQDPQGQWHQRQYTEIDTREAKQRMRQLNAYEAKFTEAMTTRIAPPVGSRKIMHVTDEQFLDLMSGYAEAKRKGEERHSPFQPLSAYVHKIVQTNPKTGEVKQIRGIIQGEVGMYGDMDSIDPPPTILILQEGYGSGNLVGVPVNVTPVGPAPKTTAAQLVQKAAALIKRNPPVLIGMDEPDPESRRKVYESQGIQLEDPDFYADIDADDGDMSVASDRDADTEGE